MADPLTASASCQKVGPELARSQSLCRHRHIERVQVDTRISEATALIQFSRELGRMTEPWEALAALKHQKQLCAAEAAALKESCSKVHQHQHITQCAECFSRLLDQIRTLCAASPDLPWAEGQPGGLRDLEGLFAEAKQNPRELQAIERRLDHAKRDWARGKIQNSRVFKRLVSEAGHGPLLQRLQDETVALEAALGEIDRALATEHPSAQELAKASEQLIEARTPQQQQHARKSILNTESLGSLDSLMEQVLEKSAASKASKEIKDKHLRRLDELRRAQTAHLKSKKKKTVQSRGTEEQDKSQHPPPLDVPPCTACATLPDPKSFISCTLCLLRSNICGQGPPAVFCTDACYGVGFDDHVTEAHMCASGDDCIQLRRAADEEDASLRQSTLVLCSDCLIPSKTMTAYCSETCAEMNFDRHQNTLHKNTSSPARDGGTAGERKKISRNIEDHVIRLSQVLADIEQKNSITMKMLN